MRYLRNFVPGCLLFVFSAGALLAQGGGQASVQGLVFDPSGAVLPAALVEVRNLDTAALASTRTNEAGLFRFPVLPPGTYQLQASAPGFRISVIEAMPLTVGASLNLSLRLAVLAPSQKVEVTVEAPFPETSRTAVSSTIDNQFISNLPVNGRDFTAFALLSPGVTRDARGGLSFGGQRAMNSLLVDGANNDDMYWGQPLTGFTADGREPPYLSQEAVQEFQVNANSYSAEFGRGAGGVINTVTKSGTNHWHGSGFWFYRDASMNAISTVNKLYGLPKDPFHYNQFGGTLGGPVRKDKAFFFFNYEGMRSSLPNAVFLNLPDGFQLSPDPAVAAFQETALNYLRPRARPWIWPITLDIFLGKLDWQLSPAHRMAIVWDGQRFSGGGALDSGTQNSFEHTDSNPTHTDFGAVALTSVVSDRTVNVARFSYLGTLLKFGSVGIHPEANVFQDGQLVLTVGRDPTSAQNTTVRQFQWSDTLSYSRGRHFLKVGADFLRARIDFFYALGFSGSYSFSTLESFGRSLSGAPVPWPDDTYQQTYSGTGTPGITTHPNVTSVTGFAQDEWHPRPNLTLTGGLRYELQMLPRPNVKNPSPALAAAGLDTTALPTDTNNIAPRLGFAWSPRASARFVVRGGYGLFYALTPAVMAGRAYVQNDVTLQTRTFFGASETAQLIPAYPNNFCGAPDPSGISPHCLPPALGAQGTPTIELFSSHYRQPYVQQGSVGVEFQLRKQLSVSASYLMTQGADLQQTRDFNLDPHLIPATIGLADTNTIFTYGAYPETRPVRGFNRILLFESSGYATYNGLALQLNKRFARFALLASYTLSKVTDNNPNAYALNTGGLNPFVISYPTDPSRDTGPGDNDQRHRLVLSGIWQLPAASTLASPLKSILGGWQLSGIFTAQSGLPYSGHMQYDLNNDGNFATDRAPGVGRNSFRLPVTASLDPRLTRNVSVGRTTLQFIWEGFNVLNHSNVTDVNRVQYAVSSAAADCGIAMTPCLVPQNHGLSAFGTPTASSGPRIMQVAVKVVF